MTIKQFTGHWLRPLAGLALACLAAGSARADQHYVSTNGLNQTPFTNWTMAATNIALPALWTAVSDGDVVVVSNGMHYVSQLTYLSKNVTISGAYDAAQTIINGQDGAYQAFWTSSAAITCNFFNITITRFGTYAVIVGAGTLRAVNCSISGNTNAAAGSGGSAMLVYSSSSLYATNCVISRNRKMSPGNGSAVYFQGGGAGRVVFDRCNLSENTGGSGGAIYILNAGGSGLIARNCLIASNNIGSWDGGGVVLQAGHRLENCTIVGNTGGTGGGVNMYGGEMVNCLVAYNSGVAGGGVNNAGGILRNCTVVGNSGGNGGGIAGGGTSVNSIVYFNAGNVPYTNFIGQVFSNSCTAPLPAGGNNITVDPMLVSLAANCRLRRGSPCINTGMFQDWMTGAVDLDGRPRIRQGAVDIGAYEWFPQGAVIKFQ